MKKLIVALLVGMTLSACSITHDEKSTESTKAYQFKVSGCDTGYHTFTTSSDSETLGQYCSALQDDAANNGCAESTRRQMFEAVCPGIWTPR